MLSREAPVRGRPAESAAGPLTRASIALALAAIALAIAPCGSDADETTSPTREAAIDLTVTLDADGEGGEPPATETVSCSPPDCPAGAFSSVVVVVLRFRGGSAAVDEQPARDRDHQTGGADQPTGPVDRRQAQAEERIGLQRFGRRVAMVRTVGPGSDGDTATV